jgi:serine/threonine-protein kinase
MNFKIDAGAWTELNQLLDQALDLPVDERMSWVESLEVAHSSLKPQLRDLIARAASVETDAFLQTLPKIDAGNRVESDKEAPTGKQGEEIGPYRLIRELGSGGMGSVWLAERTDGIMNRQVALKLPHIVGRRAGLAERMAREREILATLNHPNIATLYDAGIASDGQPYLALEYAEGKPIDVYCNEHSLDVRARLKLFTQVANAVAHAHSKLVVHRDLKPSNILINAEGQARLLDFGIAKLLEEGATKKTQLTELSGRALTPDYASPEQILGEPLTIASDVYSLGVILYELLAGVRPYKLKRDSRGALEDAILQSEPPKPSEVAAKQQRKVLRGDLDTIVVKALKKKLEDRYPTVNAFVEDVFRYLDSRPVLAQPDSGWYRFKKFVVRHRYVVAAATLVLVAVVVGSCAALWQAHVANEQRLLAQEVEMFITSIFSDASPYQQGGKRLSTIELLDHAALRIDNVTADRPELRVKLLTLLGASLLALGEVDSAENIAKRAVQSTTGAVANNDRLAAEAQLLMADVDRVRGRIDDMNVRLQTLTLSAKTEANLAPQSAIRALVLQADAAIDAGRYEQAELFARRALKIAEDKLGGDRFAPAAANILAESLVDGATPTDVALVEAERAVRIVSAAYPQEPRHPYRIVARLIHGRALGKAGMIDAAIAEMLAATRDAREVFGPKSQTVAFFLQNVSRFQRRSGDVRGSLANAAESFAIQEKLAKPDSFNYLGALYFHGASLGQARRYDEAVRELSAVVQGYSQLFGVEHSETIAARNDLASVLAFVGRSREARSELNKILASQTNTRSNARFRALLNLSRVQQVDGEYEKAIATLTSAESLLDDSIRRLPDKQAVAVEMGLANVELGRTDAANAAFDLADTLQEQSMQQMKAQVTPESADMSIARARLDLLAQDPTRALSRLTGVESFWRDLDPENRSAGIAAFWLGRCYLALGRKHESNEAFARAQRTLQHSAIPSDRQLLKSAMQR